MRHFNSTEKWNTHEITRAENKWGNQQLRPSDSDLVLLSLNDACNNDDLVCLPAGQNILESDLRSRQGEHFEPRPIWAGFLPCFLTALKRFHLFQLLVDTCAFTCLGCDYPANPITALEIQNPSHVEPELHKICRISDAEALKQWKGRSGILHCFTARRKTENRISCIL